MITYTRTRVSQWQSDEPSQQDHTRTHLHVTRLVESIHLVQQLQQNALHLPICAGLRIEPLRGNSVDFINEDDRRAVFSREAEDVAHHTRALAKVLLYELGPVDADEGRGCVVRHGFDEHRLARTFPGREHTTVEIHQP